MYSNELLIKQDHIRIPLTFSFVPFTRMILMSVRMITNHLTRRYVLSAANRKWIQGDFWPSLCSFHSWQSGINQHLPYKQLQNSVDFFRPFFDQSLIETIVRQTNIYQSSSSQMASWADVGINPGWSEEEI